MTETNLTRAEVLANRQKVVTFLLQPKRKKATGKLDRGNGNRCCLGHMCYVLKISKTFKNGIIKYGKKEVSGYAPEEVTKLLGLYTPQGELGNNKLLTFPNMSRQNVSLAAVNDCTSATPQEIGAYLQSVINGGTDTPWISLDAYPETL